MHNLVVHGLAIAVFILHNSPNRQRAEFVHRRSPMNQNTKPKKARTVVNITHRPDVLSAGLVLEGHGICDDALTGRP